MATQIKVIKAQGALIDAFKLTGQARAAALLSVLEMLKGIADD